MKKVVGAVVIAVFAGLLVLGVVFKDKLPGNNETKQAKAEETNSAVEPTEKLSISDYELADLVTIPDNYADFDVEVPYDEVTDEMITSYINQLLAQYPDFEVLDKQVVENGDKVDIDYEGKVDGETFDGGSATGYKLEIGSDTFIAGFEEGLIGAKVGETIDVNVTFPEDYSEETLQGKEAVFTVTVNAIGQDKVLTQDELTDDFVDANFGMESVEAFMEDLTSYIQENSDSDKTTNTRTAVVQKLITESAVELPNELLDSQVDNYVYNYTKSVEDAGYDMADFLEEKYQQTLDEFKAGVKTEMESSLKQQLVLSRLAEMQETEVDQEGYDAYAQSFVTAYQYEDVDALYKDYPQEELERAYLCNKMVEYLIENVRVSYVPETGTTEN